MSKKNLTTKKPNETAAELIQDFEQILESGFLKDGFISEFHSKRLEQVIKKKADADFIIHSDLKGATVISETGSITVVGNEISKVPSYKGSPEQSQKELNYALDIISQKLKSNGVFTRNDKVEIEKLDDVLQEVSLIITKDMKDAIIANSYGQNRIVNAKGTKALF